MFSNKVSKLHVNIYFSYIDPEELCQFFSKHLGEFKHIYDVVEDLHKKINTALHTTAEVRR